MLCASASLHHAHFEGLSLVHAQAIVASVFDSLVCNGIVLIGRCPDCVTSSARLPCHSLAWTKLVLSGNTPPRTAM
jgi:hypothetical protein